MQSVYFIPLYVLSSLVHISLAIARRRSRTAWAGQWISHLLYGGIFLLGAVSAAFQRPWGLPEYVKEGIDNFLTPPVLTFLTLAGIWFLWWLVRKSWGWTFVVHLIAFLWLWFLVSLEDKDFAALVLGPDHIAVLLFLGLSVLFVAFGLKLAADNDLRQQMGRPVAEAEPGEKERIFVWPDLVYIELLAMLGMLGLLWGWSLLVPAPLEAPADPAYTPNPAKAPWYFVGLQELLVYFDPWLAGVIIPIFIILGLCLIPYVDTRPELRDYYGLKHRQFSVGVFLFGYILWVLLIVIGAFYRGPDWQIYGLYESRLARKMPAPESRPLSQIVWGQDEKRGPDKRKNVWRVLQRESVGVGLCGLLFMGLPLAHRVRTLHGIVPQWSGVTHWLMSFLLAVMLLIPVKMYLNWIGHVNYILWLPEIGINI